MKKMLTFAVLAALTFHAWGGAVTFTVKYDEWGANSSILENKDFAGLPFAIVMLGTEGTGNAWMNRVGGSPFVRLQDGGTPVYVGRVDSSHIDRASGNLLRLANRAVSTRMPTGNYGAWSAAPTSWDATAITPSTKFKLVFFDTDRARHVENIDADAEWFLPVGMSSSSTINGDNVEVVFNVRSTGSWVGLTPARAHKVDETERMIVPEPSALVLLAMGATAVALRRKKRANR